MKIFNSMDDSHFYHKMIPVLKNILLLFLFFLSFLMEELQKIIKK